MAESAMADGHSNGLTFGKVFHWAMNLSMICSAAALGGGLLTMGWSYFAHIGAGLMQAPDAISNIFNAVTGMDLTSPAAAMTGSHAMTGHAAITAPSVAAPVHDMASMTQDFASCAASIPADQMTQLQGLADADGVSLDSYLKTSGLCHDM